MLKISAISLVLRTREITDIFNSFDEIYLLPSSYTQIMPEQKKKSHFSIVPFLFQTRCGFTADTEHFGTFGWYVVLGFNGSFSW